MKSLEVNFRQCTYCLQNLDHLNALLHGLPVTYIYMDDHSGYCWAGHIVAVQNHTFLLDDKHCSFGQIVCARFCSYEWPQPS